MPLFEVTLITRSMAKVDLIKTLTRTGNTLFDHGAVIEKVESLGHRDLPYKRIAKQSKEPVYASNYFLFRTHLPRESRFKLQTVLQNDLDMLHVHLVDIDGPVYERLDQHFPKEKAPECNLDELLKPPPERAGVKEMRNTQKLGHFTRQIIYKRTEKEWRAIPKSYPIPPARD